MTLTCDLGMATELMGEPQTAVQPPKKNAGGWGDYWGRKPAKNLTWEHTTTHNISLSATQGDFDVHRQACAIVGQGFGNSAAGGLTKMKKNHPYRI